MLSNGPSRVFSSTTNQKHQFFSTHSVSFMGQLSHPYMTTRKTIALTIWTFVGKVMSLLSRFDTAFLPRIKLLISWLQLPSAVILEPKKIRSVTVSTFFPCICHEMRGLEGFPGGLVVKNTPAVEDMQEMQVRSLGREFPWKRAWQPTSVFLPGESHGQRSLASNSPWGCKESDTTD